MKNQFFSFDANSGVWYNEYSDQGIMIDHASEVESGANIITAPRNNKKNLERMKWRMVPCDEVAKSKKGGHHGGEEHHEEKEKGGDKEDHEEKEKRKNIHMKTKNQRINLRFVNMETVAEGKTNTVSFCIQIN